MRPRAIRLSPDYQCFPLWEAEPGLVGDIDPADLPIDADLREALIAWADRFDSNLNWDDPGGPGFFTDADWSAFNAEGARLVERLRTALGPGWTVTSRY